MITTYALWGCRCWSSVGIPLPVRVFHLKVGFMAIILQALVSCTEEQFVPEETKSTSGQSAFITRVFDYQYAPGQHAYLLPASSKGEDFIGVPWSNGKSFISLGGWGGYIIAGFDHPVSNANGPDIAVFTQPSVASEPGIVYVMADNNMDGLPNDGTWHEIKGSEYNNPETIHNYEVTYFKPGSSGYIDWKDNQGKTGTLVPGFSTDNWWWSGYGDKSSVTFIGQRLPDAYVNTSTTPGTELWMVRSGLFSSGYAECYGNKDYNSSLKANLLDISLAVDPAGKPANLSRVSFIKIQSSVFQVAGWLNEISTEVSGAADVHLLEIKSF